MSFFDRFKKPSAPVANNDFNAEFGLKMVWERKPLPSPGAMNYAYETLALAPQSEISGAVAQRQTLSLFGRQVYKYQDAWLAGFGTVSGQIIGQPLYDPQSGYTNMPNNSTYGDLVAANIVANRQGPRGTNQPFLGGV